MSDTVSDGIVTRAHGKQFVVFADGHYFSCHLRKKVKFKTDQTTPVAVGDNVSITVIGENEGVIEEVRERKSTLSRPVVGHETAEQVVAANIDSLIIVTSIKSPPLKPGLIDRFLIAARIGGLIPAIVINKIDLKCGRSDEAAIQIYRSLGYALFLTSALTGEGLRQFRAFLEQHRSLLAGHSGVGKSTILNQLLPGIDLPTLEISPATGRGRHSTTHVELFQLPGGGFVIDSPGIKVLGLWEIDKRNLAEFYPEMNDLIDQCRFTRCSHIHEPDCAVKEAVAAGQISTLRYRNYIQIYNSL